jgi:hypothetical protein
MLNDQIKKKISDQKHRVDIFLAHAIKSLFFQERRENICPLFKFGSNCLFFKINKILFDFFINQASFFYPLK